MPSTTISQRLKESYAQANVKDVYLETLVVSSRIPGSSGGANTLDLAFAIDDTGSMGGFLDTVKNIVSELATSLETEFTSVRYALLTFKDTNTQITDFIADSAAFIDFIDALSASGGGDTAENGYGATVETCEDYAWRSTSSDLAKVVWLVTDAISHEDEATEEEAIQALLDRGVMFVLGSSGLDEYNYSSLISETDGIQISFDQSDEEVLEEFLGFIKGVANVDEPLYYIVNAPIGYNLALETGGDQFYFQPVGFNLTLPGQNDQGVQAMNISIDNVDQRIGAVVAELATEGKQMVLDYRLYIASDPTTPQNDPPLQLVMAGAKTTIFSVTGSATFADLVNMPFLTRRYTRSDFPGLGN